MLFAAMACGISYRSHRSSPLRTTAYSNVTQTCHLSPDHSTFVINGLDASGFQPGVTRHFAGIDSTFSEERGGLMRQEHGSV